VRPALTKKLEGFGTTIFAEMSALAVETGAINLGQGFPDTDGPDEVLDAVVTLLVAGDRLAQRGHAPPGGVLVGARLERRHCCGDHRGRPVDVGEPLAEVDRAGAHGQRRHLGEDRRPEPGQLGGHRVRQRRRALLGRSCRRHRLIDHARHRKPSDRTAITRIAMRAELIRVSLGAAPQGPIAVPLAGPAGLRRLTP